MDNTIGFEDVINILVAFNNFQASFAYGRK